MKLLTVKKVIIPALALIITGSGFVGCGPSEDVLEPLPPPREEPPSILSNPYYLNSDSSVTMFPEFTIRQSGIDANGNFTLTATIELNFENQSSDTIKIEPGRITVYESAPTNFIEIGTAELVPVLSEQTKRLEKIPPGSDRILTYENSLIDELVVYSLTDNYFFSVFLIIFNDNDRVFVSNKTFIGG
jgi:hypothetical protein